jgi:hypothetical protein
MSMTYKVRLEDTADAFDTLGEDKADELRELIDEDTEWLDLDMAGQYIEQLATELGIAELFADDLDTAKVKRLAKQLKQLTWQQALEHLELDQDDADYAEGYYDEFVALLQIAAEVGQGLTIERL